MFFKGQHVGIAMDHEPVQTCQCCGKCCLADFCAYVKAEDLKRWRDEDRQDILAMMEREQAVWMGDHLISADDGHYLHGCPFLAWEGDRCFCTIYTTRPRTCRNYQPGSSEICPQFKPYQKTMLHEENNERERSPL